MTTTLEQWLKVFSSEPTIKCENCDKCRLHPLYKICIYGFTDYVPLPKK